MAVIAASVVKGELAQPLRLLRCWALPSRWELCPGAAGAPQEARKWGFPVECGKRGPSGIGKRSQRKLRVTGVTLLGISNASSFRCPHEVCRVRDGLGEAEQAFWHFLTFRCQLASELHEHGREGAF